MRKMKKSSDITEMNKLRIRNFELTIDDDPVHKTLHMVGQNDVPYQPYFMVDVQFVETVYRLALHLSIGFYTGAWQRTKRQL